MWRGVAVLVIIAALFYGLHILINYNQMAEQISVRPYENPQLLPPEGAVAIDGKNEEINNLEDAKELINPVPADSESIIRGGLAYKRYCLPCHGADLDGFGPVGPSLPGEMVPLDDSSIAAQTDGELYWSLGQRKNAKPPIGRSMTTRERWDTINYLRSKQREKLNN